LDTKRPLIFFVGILPGLVSFLFFGKIMSFFGLGIEKFALNIEEYDLMQIRSFVAYIILNGGCFVFQAIIIKNDEFNQKLLHELREKTEEIKTQNEELKSSHEKLHEANQRLESLVEEKSENIKKQHQKLIHYAHANSHHVRGPIARLLGLVQLLKLDPAANYPWFFEKVEGEANEIDQITRNISRDLDDLGIEKEEIETNIKRSL
jgi:signal transduction histidine kinase